MSAQRIASKLRGVGSTSKAWKLNSKRTGIEVQEALWAWKLGLFPALQAVKKAVNMMSVQSKHGIVVGCLFRKNCTSLKQSHPTPQDVENEKNRLQENPIMVYIILTLQHIHHKMHKHSSSDAAVA